MASGSTNQNSRLLVARRRRRSRPKNKKNSSKILPNDIISKISSFLPAKSILRFKCCSKFFSELTEDKYFLKQHSDNSLLKDDPCFFIQRWDFPSGNTPERGLKIHALDKQNELSSCGVHTTFLEFLALTEAKIEASSDGLLFCRTLYKLFVCNPTTLSCSYIPSPICTERFLYDDVHVQYAFECDSEEFKLFAFDDRFNGSFECSIYDPKRDVWKVSKELFYVGDWDMVFKFPVLYKGIIHVLSQWLWQPNRHDDLVPYIATYDVESGMSRMLTIPREFTGFNIDLMEPFVIVRIFKWGKRGSSSESLCLVTLELRCFFRIWVLSDYEAKLWSSPRYLNLEEMGIAEEDLYVVDFIVMNGDCLLFATKKTVYKYDLVGERDARIEKVCGHELNQFLTFFPYSSTLRSCSKPLHTMNIGFKEESGRHVCKYYGRHSWIKS